MLAADKAPDFISTNGSTQYVSNAIRKNLALDLTPELEADPAFAADVADSTLEALRQPDGAVYTLPDAVEYIGYWYNEALFREAGVTDTGTPEGTVEPPATWEEFWRACDKLAAAEKKTGAAPMRICHVLRYSPFFAEIQNLLGAGAIGQLVSIQHIESVGYWHMAHSFVRGSWRRADESCPMILAKCCHDLDLLRWLADSPCQSVSSVGSLVHFTAAHAPQDAPAYCLDGCAHRDECPYFAPRFYLEHPRAVPDGFVRAVSLDPSPEAVLEALRRGPYGRCVYRCDNDVVDNQLVNLTFANGITASLTMCAFTDRCERIINLMGSRGQLRGNLEDSTLELLDFASGSRTIRQIHTPEGGHSGSDAVMMREFLRTLRAGAADSRSSAAVSVESHLMALAAEQSRLRGGVPVRLQEEEA
jgi:predicted dehydrogenase